MLKNMINKYKIDDNYSKHYCYSGFMVFQGGKNVIMSRFAQAINA